MFKDCSTLTEIIYYNDIYSIKNKENYFGHNSNYGQNEINIDQLGENDWIINSYNEIVETNYSDSLKKDLEVEYINSNFEKEINNDCYKSQEDMIKNYNSPIKGDKNISNNLKSNNSTYSNGKETNRSEANNSFFFTNQSNINNCTNIFDLNYILILLYYINIYLFFLSLKKFIF